MAKSKIIIPPVQNLYDDSVSQWAGKIKGFLIKSKNYYLHIYQKQIKSDGSGPIDSLVGEKITNYLLPCPVEVYDFGSYRLLSFRLGKGSFELSTPKELENSIKMEMDKALHPFWDPVGNDIWLVLHKGVTFELNFSIFKDPISHMIRLEILHMHNIRKIAFGEIGYKSIKINEPSGEPDIRVQSVSRMIDGKFYSLKPTDLLRDIKQESCLLTCCPDEVEQVVHRARLLYVHAYSEWEFFTMAVHYVVLALEASLRLIYDKWLGNEEVELVGEIENELTIVKIKGPRENILKWVNRKKAINVFANGLLLPRNKSHLVEHAVKIGVLTMWEKEQCEHLLYLRDVFSHPTGAFIEWIGWATKNISDTSMLINLMWARFYNKITNELFF